MRRENKMGTLPIGRLLVNMALPMVISMLVQALYNVVDSVYVSRVSENALTAVSMAFPIQNLMIGFSTGVGVGMSSLLSKSLGSHEFDRANKAAGNGLVLSAICCGLFMLFGLTCSGLFFDIQTDIPEIREGGTAYLQICTICSFGIFGEILFERMLQATGRTMLTMVTQGVGAILNIVLDPLFIFGGLGIPAMGVAGAAVATVVGQVAAFVLALVFHVLKNHEVSLSRETVMLQWWTVKIILAVGVPSILMVAIGSVMTFTMNRILGGFTPTAVAVFGSYFKLQSFVFMPVFGLNNAMIPIVAYNYGARKPERIRKTVILSCAVAITFMLAGFLAFQFIPETLLAMFEPTQHFLDIGCRALQTISYSYLVAGICVVLTAVFQALGNGIYATIVSLARQLVVLVPVAYLLSLTDRLELVWLAFPIAEAFSLAVTLGLFVRIYRRKLKPLQR
ncbi:MAG: MATE family efflux transporter [Candidatus Faecousia sp.]|nr:MATE family efflux transporter [Bacillota bacterium]MDY4220216.1 MATE family efflux transporter [Candidatus Faecousia sp.]